MLLSPSFPCASRGESHAVPPILYPPRFPLLLFLLLLLSRALHPRRASQSPISYYFQRIPFYICLPWRSLLFDIKLIIMRVLLEVYIWVSMSQRNVAVTREYTERCLPLANLKCHPRNLTTVQWKMSGPVVLRARVNDNKNRQLKNQTRKKSKSTRSKQRHKNTHRWVICLLHLEKIKNDHTLIFDNLRKTIFHIISRSRISLIFMPCRNSVCASFPKK